jgi:hypothetical protein
MNRLVARASRKRASTSSSGLASGTVDGEYPVYSGGAALPVGEAGVLVIGQTNARLLLIEKVSIMTSGLAAALGVAQGVYNPQIGGTPTLDAYGLVSGLKTSPVIFTATTSGGLYTSAGARAATFLDPTGGGASSAWPYGPSGLAVQRFITQLMASDERASCYGVLVLHSESDTQDLVDADYAEYVAARLNFMAKIRTDMGRTVTGSTGLPFFYIYPPPIAGSTAAGHAMVRRAWNAIISDQANNAHLACGQSCDSIARDAVSRDHWDLDAYVRRSVFGILRVLNSQRGVSTRNLPSFGPKIVHAWAESSTTTLVSLAHDRGRSLWIDAGADGRGWSVWDNGVARSVSGVALAYHSQVRLTHAAVSSPAAQRTIAFCLHGQELGHWNTVVYDNFGTDPNPAGWPAGWDSSWKFDWPLRGSLVPMAADALTYQSGRSFDDLRREHRISETLENYQAVSGPGFIGAYQHAESALASVGYYIWPDSTPNTQDFTGTWTGKNGMTSKAVYLASPAAQDTAWVEITNQCWVDLKASPNFAHTYIGQIINNTRITASGLVVGATHLGIQVLMDYLSSGGTNNPGDFTGMTVGTYVARFSGFQCPWDTDLP